MYRGKKALFTTSFSPHTLFFPEVTFGKGAGYPSGLPKGRQRAFAYANVMDAMGEQFFPKCRLPACIILQLVLSVPQLCLENSLQSVRIALPRSF